MALPHSIDHAFKLAFTCYEMFKFCSYVFQMIHFKAPAAMPRQNIVNLIQTPLFVSFSFLLSSQLLRLQ